ncbi:MAG: hypothetical protein ACQEQM_06615 [Thermoplasmatota archaeon]
MDKKVFSIGVTILLVGTFLIFAFWPLTATSARDLAEEKEDNYEDFEIGETLTVYGTITNIREFSIIDTNIMIVELDGDFDFLIEGKDSIDFSEGDVVYCDITRGELLEGFDDLGYWELEDELKSKRTIDLLFYALTGVGIAVAAYGAAKM